MGWINKEAGHSHNTPRTQTEDEDIPLGAIWECDCGEWFRVAGKRLGHTSLFLRWDHLPVGSTVKLNNGGSMTVGRANVVRYDPRMDDESGMYAPGTK